VSTGRGGGTAPVRRWLDRLHGAAFALAMAAFAAVAALVLVQVAGRLIDRAARLAGLAQPGIAVPSLAEIGGFLFLGGVFLALAGTLRAGGHVRVTLLTRALPAGAARGLSALVSAGAASLAGFATWASAVQAADSFAFGSVSYGMVPVALWIPQGVMTLGLALMCLALVEAAVDAAAGRDPAHIRGEAARGEGG